MKALGLRHKVSARGFVLLLIVLSLLAIGGAFLFVGIVGSRPGTIVLARSASADQRLQIAREAIIGYAIGAFGAGARPGQLSAPDILNDNNYDGNASTGCLDATQTNGLPALTGAAAKSANLRCLGRIPWKTLGISNEGVDEFDALGIIPWYAVSANLADPNLCLQYLNPTTVAATPVSFACPSVSAPPFPWLRVCNQTGQLLSDRVAFVVIVPGSQLVTNGRTQSRSGAPRPQPADYLDAIPLPAGWASLPAADRCTTYDNAGLTNEFVVADASDSFNDRVAYVTIDELMATIEKRVAQEVRESLVSYQTQYGKYPWLLPLMDPSTATNSWVSATGVTAGLLPFHTQLPGQSFLTELTWSIGTPSSSDAQTPTTSSSPTFTCFSGAYQCRIRTSPANAAIPRTVSSANLTPLKNSFVAAPSVSCSYSTVNKLDCTSYTYTLSTQAVTYNVQRRPVGTTTYSFWGTYTGTQSRKVTILANGIQASSTAAFSTDASSFVRRSITTGGSMDTTGMLAVTDTWVPNAAGTIPFDLSSGPLQTGTVSTSSAGTVVASNIRVYPVLPTWFVSEKWNEHILVAISADASPAVGGNSCTSNCFSVGPRTGIHLAVLSAGRMLPAQSRYVSTPTLADFLEAPNVTGPTTRVFADTNLIQTSTYADTIVTIPR